MTLSEAIAKLESQFTAHAGLSTYLSQTAEPYETIGIGLGYRVGKGSTDEELVDHWYDAVMAYAEGRGSHLYWRRFPRLDTERGVRKIYSRLLVTDKTS